MYDYYSSDKQFQRANEGLVKALVETAVTTSNAYDIGSAYSTHDYAVSWRITQYGW